MFKSTKAYENGGIILRFKKCVKGSIVKLQYTDENDISNNTP